MESRARASCQHRIRPPGRTCASVPAGSTPLRFHDLRHTYGSLLVAGGIDLAAVKSAMGHSRISTTERYLHARPASELAARFTRALAMTAVNPPIDVRRAATAPPVGVGVDGRRSYAGDRAGTGSGNAGFAQAP